MDQSDDPATTARPVPAGTGYGLCLADQSRRVSLKLRANLQHFRLILEPLPSLVELTFFPALVESSYLYQLNTLVENA
jgi:hypothetical protein